MQFYIDGCYFGIGLSAVVAALMSWSRNHSVVYAILHGILGWFYIIYYYLVYGVGPLP